MRRRYKYALGSITLLVLLAVGAMLGVWHLLETPLDRESNATIVFQVDPGETRRSVATRLEAEGLILWADGFWFFMRFDKAPLQAGEFELTPAMNPRQILNTLAFGQPILHRLHFAEGLTMREVAEAVNATGLTTGEKFLAACRDRSFLQKYGINAIDAEGYLFPETYYFPRIPKQDPYPILEALLERFHATVQPLSEADNATRLHEIVILASLVEKETGQSSERTTVAGVYANRLEREMLLQCDPTVIYGLGAVFDGNLKKIHLQDPNNAYNTYIHPGLPPGPICSPGKASLLAASAPDRHAYLYFVAKGDGSHYFSKSLEEHNSAVVRFQRKGRPMRRQTISPSTDDR